MKPLPSEPTKEISSRKVFICPACHKKTTPRKTNSQGWSQCSCKHIVLLVKAATIEGLQASCPRCKKLHTF